MSTEREAWERTLYVAFAERREATRLEVLAAIQAAPDCGNQCGCDEERRATYERIKEAVS